jgi:uncharacterized protein (TIGR02996 family)
MTIREAFLQVIDADPNDTTPRLIFADWLEEMGDPLAGCLRTEVAAAEILGHSNVHGVLDVQRHFKVQYTSEELTALAHVPFSQKTLHACAGTYILIAGAPLSLLDIRAKYPQLLHPKAGCWYARTRIKFRES